MDSRRITAVVAALILGAGTAAACGDGSREQVDKGNQDQPIPEGSRTVTERGPTTLQSTGPAQPEVTQPETGP